MNQKVNISFNIWAVISLILICFAVTPVYLQNDTFYSIRIGRYILENGIDMKDHFSWHKDLPYTYPHWAYDVFIGFLYNLGGFSAIVMSTIVLACVLGITGYFINLSLTGNRVASLFFALLIMFMLENFITARAQLVSYILLIFELFCIEKFLKTKHFGYAVGLFVIATVLANVHIAIWPFFFVIFLPYIGEYVLAKIRNIKQLQKFSFLFNPFSRITIKENKAVRFLIIIAVVCLFTGLITPLGFSPYLYLYDTIKGPSLGYINEHKPLIVGGSIRAMLVFMLFLMFFFLTTVKVSIKDLFMIGGLVALSLLGRRHFSLLAIIGITTFNMMICSYLNSNHPHISETIQKFILTIKGKIILCSVVIIITVTMTLYKINDQFFQKAFFPEGTSDYIVKNIDIKNMRLFNEYGYGSYLLFRGIPVFIDSRADLYTKEFNKEIDIFKDYFDIVDIKIFYEKKFKEYGITHVIQKKETALAVILAEDKNYKEVYSDKYFVLYERLSADK